MIAKRTYYFLEMRAKLYRSMILTPDIAITANWAQLLSSTPTERLISTIKAKARRD